MILVKCLFMYLTVASVAVVKIVIEEMSLCPVITLPKDAEFCIAFMVCFGNGEIIKSQVEISG